MKNKSISHMRDSWESYKNTLLTPEEQAETNIRVALPAKKKPLTNRAGDVRELTSQDIKEMRSASEVLPAELLKILPKRQVGEDMLELGLRQALAIKHYRDNTFSLGKSAKLAGVSLEAFI